MSAIISDGTPSTESPRTHSAKAGKNCRREEEFRSALDSYIAGYQKHLAVPTGIPDARTSDPRHRRP